MEKILITGAGGYIGSNAVYAFLQKGFEVVGIDNFSKGYRQPLELLQQKFGKDQFRFYEYDLLTDLSQLFQQEKHIDATIHYAAFCDVNESMQEPQKYFANNVAGSKNLFSHLIKANSPSVIFSSTCAVYGQAQYVPVDENHPIQPLSPYGASKRIVEEMLEWYGKRELLQYVILRYFNVTGASDDGLIGDSKKPSSLLIPNVIRGALGIASFSLTYSLVDTKDYSPVRDFINVVDLNTVHLKALDYLEKTGKNQIINVGTGTGCSVLQIVKMVEKLTGVTIALEKAMPRRGEIPVMIAKNDKAQHLLHWQPEHSLEDSLRSLITWYQKRPEGWQS